MINLFVFFLKVYVNGDQSLVGWFASNFHP